MRYFDKLKGGWIGSNYASQIRLVILLLLLFLVVLNLQITYLFEQTKRGLDREMETRLRLAASLFLQDRQERDQGRGLLPGGGEALVGEEMAFLKAWMPQAGIERVLVLSREGEPMVIEANGMILRRGIAIGLGDMKALIARAWMGETVPTPVYREPGRGFSKALLTPLRNADHEIFLVLGLITPADFLGNISRASSYIFYGFLIGIPAALIISFFFIEFVLRPFRRLSSAASGPYPGNSASLDVEGIISTYEQIIQSLRDKELEVARLYQMEQRRSHELEHYQHYLLSSISSGVLSLDSQFRIQVANEVAREILNIKGIEVQGKDAHQLFSGMPEFAARLEETLKDGMIFRRREILIERGKGENLWIGLSSSLLKNEAGGIEGAIFLLTDLTEIRALQEQMRIKENLAALGEMSAGIAHEFRNSLSTLLAQSRLLQRRLPEEGGGKSTLEEMIAEIHSLEGVLQEFLQFARPQELKIQPLELGVFLQELRASFGDTLSESGVEILISPVLKIFIGADPLALRQVFLNLIQNAQEAMPGGGQLVISAKIPRTGVWRRGKGTLPPRGFIRISVADTGKGMGAEEKRKAFVPFFTTKEKGTGLGLALVQKAIVGMGGKIEMESEPGSGTTFHLYLPLWPLVEEGGHA